MKRKNISFLVPLALGVLVLASCGEEENVFVNPLDTNGFFKAYSYSLNPGEDGITANLSNEDPGSYDDTINLESFIFNGENLGSDITPDKVVIPETIRDDVKKTNGGYKIVGLGDGFMENSSRKEVVLPKYIERIEENAFKNSVSLSSLNISSLKNLKYVGSYAFDRTPWYNSYLSSHKDGPIIFGNTLYAYKGKVTSYEVPASIKNIAADAFKGHDELKSVTFHEGLEEIGANSFSGTSLVSLSLPSSVVTIGDKAFEKAPLNEVSISASKSERNYGASVFANCNSVTSLTYDGQVSVETLGLGLDKLVKLSLNGENVIDGAISSAVKVKSLDLKGVKYLGASNLSTLVDLETITNANDLEFVKDKGLEETKYYKALSDGPVYLGKYFQGFKGAMKNITLKSDLAGIAEGALNGYEGALESLPSTLKYVGKEAFKDVKSLKNIILPNSVSVGDRAFDGCTAVTEIKLNHYTEIGNRAFNRCKNATKLALPYSDDISELFGDYIDIESYTFMDGKNATKITNGMFEGVTTLAEVKFSNTIEEIGVKAFKKCTSLKELTFPKNVSNIKTFAFQSCTSLEKINFEVEKSYNEESQKVFYEGVRNLGPFVFDSCSSLGPKFELPLSIRKVNGCIVSKTAVTSIVVNILDYYIEGITDLDSIDISKDQEWIEFSEDWNVNYEKEDEYGNPYTIPYTFNIVETK